MNAVPSISVSPMTPTRQSLASPPSSPLVAALFVQADGCYSNLTTVDAWQESRDARRYDGKLPVVAHPPCSRWSRLARSNGAALAMKASAQLQALSGKFLSLSETEAPFSDETQKRINKLG